MIVYLQVFIQCLSNNIIIKNNCQFQTLKVKPICASVQANDTKLLVNKMILEFKNDLNWNIKIWET